MNPFHVYLRSELGKLKNLGDATWFLRSVSSAVLKECHLKNDSTELAESFSDQEKVDAFVLALNASQLKMLTQSCDEEWRKNGVFEKLSDRAFWSHASVPIELVDVQVAEVDAAHIFKRHRFQLSAIAQDSELWMQLPYREWVVKEMKVGFGVGLGRLKSRRYQLFDGIHRAILLARQGADTLEMCFYEVPNFIELILGKKKGTRGM